MQPQRSIPALIGSVLVTTLEQRQRKKIKTLSKCTASKRCRTDSGMEEWRGSISGILTWDSELFKMCGYTLVPGDM